ncbi:MAG: hypothetical protein H0Z40_01385 [Desulfotomaculum sp.]|nr:hypothetical protein [Desulfotomaculum sp.]
MPAQHKRPGRTAREERRRRTQAKQVQVRVVVFQRPKPAMHGPGRVVAIGEVV